MILRILLVAWLSVICQQGMAKDLTIGVEDIEYYPLYAQRSGEYAGFAREFFDAFAQKYNHKITYKPLPIKRLYSDFFNGRIDLKFPDSPYWMQDKRQKLAVNYSQSVVDYIDGVMVSKKNLDKGVDHLKVLGSVRGFTPWTYLSQINAGEITVKENADIDGLIRLIESGRVDGGYFNVSVAQYFLRHTLFEPELVVFDTHLPYTKDSYLASSIHHPDVIQQLDEFIQNEAKFIQTLKTKYEIHSY